MLASCIHLSGVLYALPFPHKVYRVDAQQFYLCETLSSIYLCETLHNLSLDLVPVQHTEVLQSQVSSLLSSTTTMFSLSTLSWTSDILRHISMYYIILIRALSHDGCIITWLLYISFYLIVVNRNNVMPLAVAYISELCRITRDELFMREKSLQIADIACSKSDSMKEELR